MNITERVKKLIEDQAYHNITTLHVTPETTLVHDLGFDSLDMVELAFAVEEEFDLPDIADEDAARFLTANDITTYVQNRMHKDGNNGQ